MLKAGSRFCVNDSATSCGAAGKTKAEIDAAVATVRQRLAGTDRHALQAAVAALNRVTADFAARRMDRGVAGALTGRRVDLLARD